MATVYITNRGPHDFSSAQKYGKLVFLSRGIFNPYAVGRMYRTFHSQLKRSTSQDYLLITGLTIMNIIAAVVFSNMHGQLNLLLYDMERNRYVPKTLVFETEEGR
jgi:hypothetical protein